MPSQLPTAVESAFVTAYRLDGRGGGVELDNEALHRAWDSDNAPLWLHLDFRHDDVTDYLGSLAGLEEAVIEVLKEGRVRTKDIGGNSRTSEMGDAVAEKVITLS